MLFKRTTFWLALTGLALGTLLVLRMSAAPTRPEPPLPLPEKPFAHGIGASGLVEARHQNTSLGVPASGLVTKVFVDVWDKVKAGEPILQLDDREFRAQQLDNEALVKLRAAQLARARDQFQRIQYLHNADAISTDERKRREHDALIAEADLDSAKASVARTGDLIERLTVRAPIDGTVLQVNLREGEYAAGESGGALVVLGDIESVWVRADIDEQVAPRVKPNQRAVGYLKGDVTRPIPMEFVRIEPFVIPKRSLTGGSTERVDTRVLQVIYEFRIPADRRVYVGQQIDLFIEDQPEPKIE